MCAYSTDRTHIRVCSIVGVFAEVVGGGFPTGFHEQNQVSVNGNVRGVLPTALLVRYFVVSLVG